MNPLKLSIYLHFGLEKLKMSNIDSTNSVIVYIRLSDRSETDMLTSSASLNVNVYSHNYMYVYNDRYTWFYESLFYITSYNLHGQTWGQIRRQAILVYLFLLINIFKELKPILLRSDLGSVDC